MSLPPSLLLANCARSQLHLIDCDEWPSPSHQNCHEMMAKNTRSYVSHKKAECRIVLLYRDFFPVVVLRPVHVRPQLPASDRRSHQVVLQVVRVHNALDQVVVENLRREKYNSSTNSYPLQIGTLSGKQKTTCEIHNAPHSSSFPPPFNH